jgi:ABC-type branched-subunit amino acid transport system permease subunit
VPFFWKPFWNLPLTLLLGLLIPAICSFVLGYFVFRSRVRGVYFAILSQAIAVAGWLVFCRNDVKLCGTNGLTRFDIIAPAESLTTFHPEAAKDQWIASHDGDMAQDLNADGKLDQLDYSMAEVGFSLAEPTVQLSLYLITLLCLFGSFFFVNGLLTPALVGY